MLSYYRASSNTPCWLPTPMRSVPRSWCWTPFTPRTATSPKWLTASYWNGHAVACYSPNGVAFRVRRAWVFSCWCLCLAITSLAFWSRYCPPIYRTSTRTLQLVTCSISRSSCWCAYWHWMERAVRTLCCSCWLCTCGQCARSLRTCSRSWTKVCWWKRIGTVCRWEVTFAIFSWCIKICAGFVYNL